MRAVVRHCKGKGLISSDHQRKRAPTKAQIREISIMLARQGFSLKARSHGIPEFVSLARGLSVVTAKFTRHSYCSKSRRKAVKKTAPSWQVLAKYCRRHGINPQPRVGGKYVSYSKAKLLRILQPHNVAVL